MLLITVEITSSISMLSPRLIRKSFHWSEGFVPYEEEIWGRQSWHGVVCSESARSLRYDERSGKVNKIYHYLLRQLFF
jgi:hypothetical protein